jgi:hypothetical protein
VKGIFNLLFLGGFISCPYGSEGAAGRFPNGSPEFSLLGLLVVPPKSDKIPIEDRSPKVSRLPAVYLGGRKKIRLPAASNMGSVELSLNRSGWFPSRSVSIQPKGSEPVGLPGITGVSYGSPKKR